MSTKVEEHGIGISIKRTKKRVFIELSMIGTLKDKDYKMFVPMIDKALKKAKELEVDMLVDMRGFKGWELLAAWDDMKFGIKHRKSFNKIAIIGNKKWEELSIKMMSGMMKGETKYFKERDKALSWLLKD